MNAIVWLAGHTEVCQVATVGPKSVRLGNGWLQTAPRTASAGQYATLTCKPLLFRFPCNWEYINVGTFNIHFK